MLQPCEKKKGKTIIPSIEEWRLVKKQVYSGILMIKKSPPSFHTKQPFQTSKTSNVHKPLRFLRYYIIPANKSVLEIQSYNIMLSVQSNSSTLDVLESKRHHKETGIVPNDEFQASQTEVDQNASESFNYYPSQPQQKFSPLFLIKLYKRLKFTIF